MVCFGTIATMSGVLNVCSSLDPGLSRHEHVLGGVMQMLMGPMWPLCQIFAVDLKICVRSCRGRSEVTPYSWMEVSQRTRASST